MKPRHALAAVAFTALLGRTLHDVIESGTPSSDWAITGLAPAMLLMLVAVKVLRGVALGALAWGVLNLAGAIVTALPAPWLPFTPDQTTQHYVAHVLYGCLQVPIILWAAKFLRWGTHPRARVGHS